MEATAAAQMLLQLAAAGGVDGQTPMQLLQRAEELLTGPYALPAVSDLQQQHKSRVDAELAAAAAVAAGGAVDAGVAGGEDDDTDYTGCFEVFSLAAGKYAVKWRGMQQLLAKVLWHQLPLQPDVAALAARQQLIERYMKAAAAAGSADSMAAGFDAVVAVSAAVRNDVMPQLAAAVGELPQDAAAWQALLQGSWVGNSAQDLGSWTAYVQEAHSELVLSWQRLMQQTADAAQCGDEQVAAIMRSTTTGPARVRSAAAADRNKAIAAAAKALLQLPAVAADQLQQAVQACKQQVKAFDLVLRRSEGHAAPAAAVTVAAAAAATAASAPASCYTAGSSGAVARPLKQQKRALRQMESRFDVDAFRSMSPYLRLYRARETARTQVTADFMCQ
jgi:hypothetical protein